MTNLSLRSHPGLLRLILRLAICLMAVAALLRMGKEIPRFLDDADPVGALDLKVLHYCTQQWPVRGSFYTGGDAGRLAGSVYPPATYALLWPLLGWPGIDGLKVFWLLATLAGLAWISAFVMRQGQAARLEGQMLLLLLPWAGYAASTTILVGQTTVLVFVALSLVLIRLERSHSTKGGDVLTAALMVFALLKPPVTAPFFWLLLFRPGRFRVAVLTLAGYLLVGGIATSLRPESFFRLHYEWLTLSQTWQFNVGGHVHLHRVLAWMGLGETRAISSLVLLFVFGGWVFVHRRADFWSLLGITGIFSRVWIYHRLYDDLLILFAVIALARGVASANPQGLSKGAAKLLLVANMIVLLSPSQVLRWDSFLAVFMEASIALVWLSTLGFLMHQVRRSLRSAAGQPHTADSTPPSIG